MLCSHVHQCIALPQLVRSVWLKIILSNCILSNSENRFLHPTESSLFSVIPWMVSDFTPAHTYTTVTQRSKERSLDIVNVKGKKGTIKNICFSPCLFSYIIFPSLSGSRMLEYGGSTWHEDCFMCHGCEKPIGAESFIPDKNNYYCVPCYEGRFAPQCSQCKKVSQVYLKYNL